MKIHNFSGTDIPNNQHPPLHGFGPRPMNWIPKQDTVKVHAIALNHLMSLFT